MATLSSSPLVRWLVPAAAAAAVLGGGAAIGTLTAAADPQLPARSAAQLLVDLQTARLDGLSGTVVQRADLGLPALPAGAGPDSSDLSALISGRHTLRVWYAGPDQARIAVLGTMGESDIIVNKPDVWLWNSRDNTATHLKLDSSEPAGRAGLPKIGPNALPLTPQQAADAALAVLDPSTVVSTAGSATVAGRDAYELVLAPRDRASLVSQVRLAIDAVEKVPLRVQVYPRTGAEPAFEVAFTQINFARPDAAQFQFNPPPGAKVEEKTAAEAHRARDKAAEKAPGRAPADHTGDDGPAVVGSGWTTVLVARVPAADGTAPPRRGGPADGAQLLGEFTQALPRVSGAWGSGRLLSGTLFSVLITDDGRVLGGLVSPDRLYQVAADPAAGKAGRAGK